MSTEWDRQTAVADHGDGVYLADLADGWRVGGGVNGGYLLATIGHALSEVTEKRDPLSVSAYYVGASVPGPAEIRTRVIRDGGSVATMAADLWQGEEHRISVLASYGDLGRLPEDVRTTAAPMELPPREECVSNEHAPEHIRAIAPLMERFEMLFDPDSIGWAMGEPSGQGELRAWFRLADERDPDPVSLLMVCDALPPVTFDLGLFGWAPTIELTVHVRAVPVAGWLQVRHATRNLAGGMFEEDCEVWDESGRLVAQSRQLARTPRPA
jgi:acyl-CoA thioesterase